MTLPRKPIVGLIGAIGAGKSTAAQCLARRGGAVVDADKIGHLVLDLPEVRTQLVSRWGDKILKSDGTVNRRALGEVVFATAGERTHLEAIVFPHIHEHEETAFQQADTDGAISFIVLDAAVLLEAGRKDICNKILFIDAARSLRLDRVKARNNWDDAELARREAAQWPLEKKRSMSDAVLQNDTTVEALQQAIDETLEQWDWWHQDAARQQSTEGSAHHHG